MAGSAPRRAAALRKALSRELRRLDAAELGIYVHGTTATVRLTDVQTGERASASVATVLAALRTLPDRSGARETLDALARESR